MTEDTWGSVQHALQKSVGQNNYVTWIEPLRFADFTNGVLRFEVPTSFIGNWVARNYKDQILKHLISAGAEVNRIEFDVAQLSSVRAKNRQQSEDQSKPRKNPASQESGQYAGAPLDARLTFDTFVVGKPNELAHASARRVAEGDRSFSIRCFSMVE